MKTRLTIVLVAAALVFAGCHSKPHRVFQNAINNLDLEKAPELSQPLLSLLTDYDHKDFKKIYAATSKNLREQLAAKLQTEITDRQAAIAYYKDRLADKTEPGRSKKFYKRQIHFSKKRLEFLNSCVQKKEHDDNDDNEECDERDEHAKRPARYLKYLDTQNRAPMNLIKDLARGRYTIVSEQITGDRGAITLSDDKARSNDSIHFIKEAGAWRWDWPTLENPPAEPVTPGLKETLDNMHLEKAPTLGPVFKHFCFLIDAKEYDKAYAMFSKGSPEKAFEFLRTHGDNEAQSFKGDARMFFIQMFSSKYNPVARAITEHPVIAGETIDGDNGVINFEQPPDHGRGPVCFIKENGEWKWDVASGTRDIPPPKP